MNVCITPKVTNPSYKYAITIYSIILNNNMINYAIDNGPFNQILIHITI